MEEKELVEKEPETKEETPKKKSNGIIFVLCGIIIILLAVVGFLLWQNMSKEKPDNTKTEPKEEVKTEEVSIDDSLVTEAYSLIPKGICGDVEFELEKNDRTISDLSNKEKMKMIESHYRMQMIRVNEDEKFYITNDELKRYFEDISFVKDYVENTADDKRSIGLADEILYNDGKLSMKHLYGTGCEGPSQGTRPALYSAKKTGNLLALNVIVFTQKAINDEMDSDGKYHFVYEIYRDEDQKEKGYEGYFDGENAAKEKLDANFFYGYQFVFNTADDTVRLESIKYLDHLSEGL